MSKKNFGMPTVTTVCVAIASVAVAYFVYKKCSSSKEGMIAEFFHLKPKANPFLPKSLAMGSLTGTEQYALWVVPGVQPHLSSAVKKFGAYHIELFPLQHLPSSFNLEKVMLHFPADVSRRWNLMLQSISVNVKHTKFHRALMTIKGASTITALRQYFASLGLQNPNHDHVSKAASMNYMLLGSDDPYDQAKPSDFTYQTQWYVQLVEGPTYHQVVGQRVMLYAQSSQG